MKLANATTLLGLGAVANPSAAIFSGQWRPGEKKECTDTTIQVLGEPIQLKASDIKYVRQLHQDMRSAQSENQKLAEIEAEKLVQKKEAKQQLGFGDLFGFLGFGNETARHLYSQARSDHNEAKKVLKLAHQHCDDLDETIDKTVSTMINNGNGRVYQDHEAQLRQVKSQLEKVNQLEESLDKSLQAIQKVKLAEDTVREVRQQIEDRKKFFGEETSESIEDNADYQSALRAYRSAASQALYCINKTEGSIKGAKSAGISSGGELDMVLAMSKTIDLIETLSSAISLASGQTSGPSHSSQVPFDTLRFGFSELKGQVLKKQGLLEGKLEQLHTKHQYLIDSIKRQIL